MPAAVAALADSHPGLEVGLTDTHPPEAIELLRAGKVEVAIIFRYDETEPEPAGVRLHHLLDDPVYVLSTRRERGLRALRDATWIAGCERCRSHLLSLCADAGFEPRIGSSSDDMVVMQALVAAGLGVATQTGLALRAHGIDGVVATKLPGSHAAHLRRDLRRAARPARDRRPARGARRGRHVGDHLNRPADHSVGSHGLQVEDLGGDVAVGVRAADEPPHSAARGGLDGVSELGFGGVLEEQPDVAQALMLAHRGQVLLGGRERVLERRDDDVRTRVVRRGLRGAAAEVLLVEPDHLPRDLRELFSPQVMRVWWER